MIYEVKELYSNQNGVPRYYESLDKANKRLWFRLEELRNNLDSPMVRYIKKEKLEYPVLESVIIHYLSDNKPEFIAIQVSEFELE
ncbi:hypothetical protein D3C73_185390 [compost metagenome]